MPDSSNPFAYLFPSSSTIDDYLASLSYPRSDLYQQSLGLNPANYSGTITYYRDPSVSTDFGVQALAQGANSAAFGPYAFASQDFTTAIGYKASAVLQFATAVGEEASAAAYAATAIGRISNALAIKSVAIGNAAYVAVAANYSTVVGESSRTSGASSVVIGQGSVSGGSNDSLVGQGVTSGTGGGNTLVGQAATCATGNTPSNVVIGTSAIASGGGGDGRNVVIGVSAFIFGNNSVFIGKSCSATNSVSSGNTVAIGASILLYGFTSSVFIGDTIAGTLGASSAGTVVIGANASSNAASYSVAIGCLSAANYDYSISIGAGAAATTSNQMVVGSQSYSITDAYFGRGKLHTGAAQSTNIHASDASGTSVAGDNLGLYGGAPTGSGVGGYVGIFTAPAGAAGTTLRTPVEHVRVDQLGNCVLQINGALATNATDGFTYIPTCAGAATGTPTSFTGALALVYDSTNNNLYVYNGGWKKVALA